MADLFVMCPDCGLRARVTDRETNAIDGDGKCKHRQNPLACPLLAPLIASLRRAPRP